MDLVIIGASFAGLSCAIAAAKAGLKVAILERHPKTGHRPATTGLLVREAADFYEIPASLTHKISTVRLYDAHLQAVTLHSKNYFFLATDTAALLEWLAAEAIKAGVIILYNSPFQHYKTQGQQILLPELGLTTRFLAGADGARSKVAKAAKLVRNRQFLLGIEYDDPLPNEFPRDSLHCFLNHRLAPGYLGWVVGGVGRLQVGLAVRHPAYKPKGLEFRQHIKPVFPTLTDTPGKMHGGLIPVGGLIFPFYRQQIMLIGDAAGWVSPLTAGGIRLSFELGYKSGELIAAYLQKPLAKHPGEVIQQYYPHFNAKKMARLIWQSGIAHPFLPLLRWPWLQRRVGQHIFFDRQSQVDLGY